MIECRALAVSYGETLALAGVSLAVRPGELTAIVGGDGAGKTTLLRALVGLVRPSAGWVRRPPRHQIGYMPAGAGVYPDLTVEENLAFAGATFGMRGDPLRLAAEGILERTGLGAARSRLGGQLSGGMRQKLSLGMALLHAPAVLVLDEPTTGVDPVSRAELWGALAAAAAAGAAVVLSTTYLDEAERAHEAVVLDAGRALVRGTPEAVVTGLPGSVLAWSGRPPDPGAAWRRGRGWRSWSPDGTVPPGAERVDPDFQDAVIVASLAPGHTAGDRP